MKKVLVLGAGLVAGPMVRYLLELKDVQVTVASRTVDKANELIKGHPNGKAIVFDIEKDANLDKLVAEHDVSVSLLPYIHHVKVANACIKAKRHMVTTSYISQAMKELDADAKKAGIVVLNELGLDPGIDHMEAMRIIEEVHAKGGKINGFVSYCGGLPAPEANDNPLGYKFSWSPRGVMLAGRNSAKFLRDGKIVDVENKNLFATVENVVVPGVATFEGYPNRDSVPYRDLYGIPGTKTMFRGTLRNKGWCETMKKLGELGIFSLDEKDWGRDATWADLTRTLSGAAKTDNLKAFVSKKLAAKPDSTAIKNFEWIGLFSAGKLPMPQGSPLDNLAKELEGKMAYKPGERDMIVLQHVFDVEGKDGKKERITSTLVDYGVPDGDSAMARTVSIPAAIGVKLILQGKVQERGVIGPMTKDIYGPALKELAALGIKFTTTKA